VSGQDRVDAFVALSAEITGFTPFDLHGTGQAEEFRATVADVVGEDILTELLDTWERIVAETEAGSAPTSDVLRREIFSDQKLGPVARNMIKLWYVGIWYELPPDWIDAYGALERDRTFMVSPSAYTEGLIWPAIGGNPPGAKGPGYASWTGPPRIPEVPGPATD
jgi:hypothetical protein